MKALRRRLTRLEADRYTGNVVMGWIVTHAGELGGFAPMYREADWKLEAWLRDLHPAFVFLIACTLDELADFPIIPPSMACEAAVGMVRPYLTPGEALHLTT